MICARCGHEQETHPSPQGWRDCLAHLRADLEAARALTARLEREHAGRNVVEAERLALILQMEQRLLRLETALRFYADANHYEDRLPFEGDSDAWADSGAKARAALESA